MRCLFLIIFVLSLTFPKTSLANGVKPDSSNGGVLLGVINSSGVNLNVTGYDWQEYAAGEKFILMSTMFAFYKLDDRYSVNKAVNLLDVHYYQAQKLAQNNPELDADAYLGAPCLWTFGSILGDKETDWGVKAIIVEKGE